MLGGGIYYTRMVQVPELRVYGRQISSTVEVAIPTYSYRKSTEHTTIPGVRSYKTLAFCQLAGRLNGRTLG
jgi:hypothetical protein